MAKKKKKKELKPIAPGLEQALNDIEREFGQGTVMKLGARGHVDAEVISTGSLALDIALGIGGLPRGRIVEVYGPESSGKSTLCQHIIANAQATGGTAAFIDTEHAIDPVYAATIGVDVDNLLISQPDCGEDALNIAERLLRSNALDVIVVDSVAALVPRAEIEGQMGDSHVGLQARLMSQALRKITSLVANSKTCFIFTNQIREKIGVMFGNPETTSGGNALKFYASIRMDIRKIETLKASGESGDPIGQRVRVKIIKNKCAPPFRKAEFNMIFPRGIAYEHSLLQAALDDGLVEKHGSWFSRKGEQLGQGFNQTAELLASDVVLAAELDAEVRETHGLEQNKALQLVAEKAKKEAEKAKKEAEKAKKEAGDSEGDSGSEPDGDSDEGAAGTD
jgi:recombination protein RecA